jgi:hypothetical protein
VSEQVFHDLFDSAQSLLLTGHRLTSRRGSRCCPPAPLGCAASRP